MVFIFKMVSNCLLSGDTLPGLSQRTVDSLSTLQTCSQASQNNVKIIKPHPPKRTAEKEIVAQYTVPDTDTLSSLLADLPP